VPVTTVAAPNVGALTAASSAAGAGDAAANTQINTTGQSTEDDSAPSIVTVQVIGYGGDDED